VEIFGTDSVFKNRTLELIGINDSNNAVVRTRFELQVIYRGDLEQLTLEEQMGIHAYQNYTKYNPDPWDDGFNPGPYPEKPYNAGPFFNGSYKVLFLPQ
jgi:hypothetical protein